MSQSEHTGRAQLAPPALELELEAIDRQQRRFSRLSLLAIVVSFVHMAAALALFSGAAWYELGAALAMTALVDVATWALAGYFDYAARRRLARSVWIKATFGFALAISMFLNGAYLYANRPPSLPGWMSVGIAGAFAVFVPMLIGVASLIRGELEDDRLRLQQQASLVPVANTPAASPELSRTPPPRTRTTRGELPSFANATPERSRTTTTSPVGPALAANDRAASPAPANSVRAPAANDSHELPVFANVTPERSRTTPPVPVTPALAENEPPLQSEPAGDVRMQSPFASGTFAATSANSTAASAANGVAAVRARTAPGLSPDEAPFLSTATNPDGPQGFVNAQPAVYANANTPIPTNDVPGIVAALCDANVRTFASARALARICGWTSSSSGPKALKQLLAAGAVRETAGGFALVEPGSEPAPGALAEPFAPAGI